MGLLRSPHVFDEPLRAPCDRSCGKRAQRVLVLAEPLENGGSAITMRFLCDKHADEVHGVFNAVSVAALPEARV